MKYLKIFSSCFFLLIAGTSLAQKVMPLYKGTPPGNTGMRNKERSSKTEGSRPSVTNVSVPTLTAFFPTVVNGARSAVIICPGGGYGRLTIEDGGYEAARTFAGAGITAFVLKYRTYHDSAFTAYRDLPLQDLQQAFTIVYANSGKWNIDTNKIGVLGFSAGGHLVGMSAVSATGRIPAFTLFAYPVISFTDALVSQRLRSRNTLLGKNITDDDKNNFSPELHVTAHTPPAFLVHAADDSTSMVENSIAYYKALLKNHVASQLKIYQAGGHGFAMYNAAMKEAWFPDALNWLAYNKFYDGSKQPGAVEDLPAFWNDIRKFKKADSAQAPPQHSILFIGSSSFTRWENLQTWFPGYPVLNRGFGGSTLPDVTRYAYDVIIPYKPKQVLIYCGENDLASSPGIQAADVVTRFKTLFGIIRQNLPGTVISFVSIKPSPVRASIQPRVIEANRDIKAFISTQKNAQFIDIYGSMLDAKGNMREELYVEDRLHMTVGGYEIWKKIITPYLLSK